MRKVTLGNSRTTTLSNLVGSDQTVNLKYKAESMKDEQISSESQHIYQSIIMFIEP